MMKHFFGSESGQGLVEYGLIIALVATVAVISLTAVGEKATGLLSGVSDKLAYGK